MSQFGGLPGGLGGIRATLGGCLGHVCFDVGLAGLDGLVGETSEVLATPTRSIEGRGGLGGLFGLYVLKLMLVNSEVYGL